MSDPKAARGVFVSARGLEAALVAAQRRERVAVRL